MAVPHALRGMSGRGAPGLKTGAASGVIALCAFITAATAEDVSWSGWQTDDGGRVVWGIPQSDAFVSFTCNGGGTVEFWNDAALPADFLNDPFIRLKVDGSEFRLRADAHYSEMNDAYEGTVALAGNDPFLKAVAKGSTLQIYDLTNERYYPNPISLAGTEALFRTYLSGCLVD